MRRPILAAFMAVVCAIGGTAMKVPHHGATMPRDPVPHCQSVIIYNNSGEGPNWHVQMCGYALDSPGADHIWGFVVDATPIQNRAVIFEEKIPVSFNTVLRARGGQLTVTSVSGSIPDGEFHITGHDAPEPNDRSLTVTHHDMDGNRRVRAWSQDTPQND